MTFNADEVIALCKNAIRLEPQPLTRHYVIANIRGGLAYHAIFDDKDIYLVITRNRIDLFDHDPYHGAILVVCEKRNGRITKKGAIPFYLRGDAVVLNDKDFQTITPIGNKASAVQLYGDGTFILWQQGEVYAGPHNSHRDCFEALRKCAANGNVEFDIVDGRYIKFPCH